MITGPKLWQLSIGSSILVFSVAADWGPDQRWRIEQIFLSDCFRLICSFIGRGLLCQVLVMAGGQSPHPHSDARL